MIVSLYIPGQPVDGMDPVGVIGVLKRTFKESPDQAQRHWQQHCQR